MKISTSNSVEGRSIVITGSGRGIGKEIAMGLASAGAKIVVADIDPTNTEATTKEINASGGTAVGIVTDVVKRTSIKAAIDKAVTEFGQLDVMFNNAGIAQAKPFNDITEEDWHRVLNVNGLGVFLGIQEASKQFIKQGNGGKIINTASIAGKIGYEPLAHYSASKFGVIGLTQAAARAFGKHQITVNAICPGVVATDMWETIGKQFKEEGLTSTDTEAFENYSIGILLERPSQSEDLVGVSQFLASSGSNYMTGQSLIVDGGIVFS